MCVRQIEFLTVRLLVQLLSAIRRPDITQAARLVGGWCTVVQKAKIVSRYYAVSRYLGTLCCILWYDSALYIICLPSVAPISHRQPGWLVLHQRKVEVGARRAPKLLVYIYYSENNA